MVTNTTATRTHPSLVAYYTNGNIRYEEWHNKEGKRHRTDGTAYTAYAPGGAIKSEQWWQYGEKIEPPAH